MPSKIPKTVAKLDGAHSDNIWSLCWTSEGNLISGSLDGTVKVFNVKDDQGVASEISCLTTSSKQNTAVTSVASVGDGSIVIACYQDSVIRLLSTDNMTEISTITPGLMEAWHLDISSNDAIIASGSHAGTVNLWSMQQGHEKIDQLSTNGSFILDVNFHECDRLATSSIDGIVRIFDVNTKQVIFTTNDHKMPTRAVRLSHQGSLLHTACDDRHVNAYDINSGQIISSFSHSSMARSVDVSSDRRHFVVGCSSGEVVYWDQGMQRRIESYDNHKEQVWNVKFDKSFGRTTRFASVGDEGVIQIYQ